MKKLMMAAVILVIFSVNHASAEMVNIGMGQMEQSEFMALKTMIQGRQPDAGFRLSTPIAHPERYGMVEMAPADFAALRDKVAGRTIGLAVRPGVKAVRMVSIGTGEMPLDEFIALKKMVRGTDLFILRHLAAAQP